jgi:hypothetical protein
MKGSPNSEISYPSKSGLLKDKPQSSKYIASQSETHNDQLPSPRFRGPVDPVTTFHTPISTAPIFSRQIIIPSQGVDRAHYHALESEISERFKPDQLDKFGSCCYLTWDNESAIGPEPRDWKQIESWSGDLVSISKDNLQPTEIGSLMTPEGGTVIFRRKTMGSITLIVIPESHIEHKPAKTDGESVAVGGRVRVRSDLGGKVSPWLKAGDAPMKSVEGTNILIWSLPIEGLGPTADEVSNEHEER